MKDELKPGYRRFIIEIVHSRWQQHLLLGVLGDADVLSHHIKKIPEDIHNPVMGRDHY